MGQVMWDEAWNTGIETLDAQHRELFRQLNRLVAALGRGVASDQVPELLAFLADYVDRHFADEEAAMAATGYPQAEHHRALHAAMRQDVGRLMVAYTAEPAVLTLEVVDWMLRWLMNHIGEADRKLAAHLRQQAGVQAVER